MLNDPIETTFVCTLFVGYLVLWGSKRRLQKRSTGADPEVLRTDSTPLQAYFRRVLKVLTLVVVTSIVLHSFASSEWGALARVQVLDNRLTDVSGLLLGVAGLGLCLAAQITMGNSWRVGIDAEHETTLIDGGVFRWCRNPTYVGLFAMNGGLWLIWPSALNAAYWALFFVVIEFQVRAEEEHLSRLHGRRYEEYRKRSWRYVPGVY